MGRQKPGRKILFFAAIVIVTALMATGCGGPKIDTDDTKYGFTEYIKDSSGTVKYALDKNSNLFSYTINKDPKGNQTLVCTQVAENTGGIKQQTPSATLLFLTGNGDLYGEGHWAGGSGLTKILDNVSEYRTDNDSGGFSNVMALKKDGTLYGWGQNRLGEVGNGRSQNDNTNPEVKKPQRIMGEVKNFDLAKNDKTYYGAAALTNNGDLFVWSFARTTMSLDFKNSMEHRLFSPVKRLEQVKSFVLQEKGALASTDQGDILINEERIRDEKFDKAYGDKKNTGTQATSKPAGTDTTVEGNLVVTFKDSALEKEIRKIMKKPSGDLFKSDVAKWGSLELREKAIKDLSGIENFTSLYSLKLYSTQVTDLAGLQNLTALTRIDLFGNESLKDISAIKGMTQLTEFALSGGKVYDLSPLQGLSKLKNLHLENLPDNDLSALSALGNLETLFIQDSNITDISALKALGKLQTLSLGRNKLRDVSPLKNLSQLNSLELFSNQLSDLSPLKGLSKLDYLNVQGNQISDISPLKGLGNLRKLGLNENAITDEAAKESLKKALPGCQIYF